MLSRETACVAVFTPQRNPLKQPWQRRQNMITLWWICEKKCLKYNKCSQTVTVLQSHWLLERQQVNKHSCCSSSHWLCSVTIFGTVLSVGDRDSVFCYCSILVSQFFHFTILTNSDRITGDRDELLHQTLFCSQHYPGSCLFLFPLQLPWSHLLS